MKIKITHKQKKEKNMKTKVSMNPVLYFSYLILALASLGIITNPYMFTWAKCFVIFYLVIGCAFMSVSLSYLVSASEQLKKHMETINRPKPESKSFPVFYILDFTLLCLLLFGKERDVIGALLPTLLVIKIVLLVLTKITHDKIS